MFPLAQLIIKAIALAALAVGIWLFYMGLMLEKETGIIEDIETRISNAVRTAKSKYVSLHIRYTPKGKAEIKAILSCPSSCDQYSKGQIIDIQAYNGQPKKWPLYGVDTTHCFPKASDWEQTLP